MKSDLDERLASLQLAAKSVVYINRADISRNPVIKKMKNCDKNYFYLKFLRL